MQMELMTTQPEVPHTPPPVLAAAADVFGAAVVADAMRVRHGRRACTGCDRAFGGGVLGCCKLCLRTKGGAAGGLGGSWDMGRVQKWCDKKRDGAGEGAIVQEGPFPPLQNQASGGAALGPSVLSHTPLVRDSVCPRAWPV